MSKALALLMSAVAAAVAAWVTYRYMAPAPQEAGAPPLPVTAASTGAAGPAREFAVEGMTCGGCVDTVTKALEQVPGVKSAKVVLAEKKAFVDADRSRVTDAQIVAAITAVGYTGQAAAPASPAVKPEPGSSYCIDIPKNLGEPQVDDPGKLQRLDKASPVWLDKQNKQVVFLASTCKAGYPLEFFATYPDRSYESVVVVYTKPSIVHAGLLALGAKPGKPASFDPTFTPPTGCEVEINVVWKDAQGKRQTARAQDWIRDIKTKKPLDVNWVFTGSTFWEDKETGSKSYLADRGDFISVLNLPSSLLDVPIKSASALESRMFEGAESLPPTGTPVTVLLKPKLEVAAK
jgi:copper chaperone CopZ